MAMATATKKAVVMVARMVGKDEGNGKKMLNVT
jgi:hypothetical protein